MLRKTALFFVGLLFMYNLVPCQDDVADTSFIGDTLVRDTISDEPEEMVIIPPDSNTLKTEEDFEEDVFRFSLRSPHDAIKTHLYFLQDEHYYPDSAARTLYIKDPSSETAIELAIQLKQVLDGAGYFIDLDLIPEDPDYIDSVSKKHKYVPVDEAPEIFLYKKGKKWVYSFSTVQAIPGLHSKMYPFGTLEWLPDWCHKKAGGLQLWQYFGILIYIFLTYFIHRLLTALIGFILEKILVRFMKSGTTVTFFRKIASPISLLIMFYILLAVTPNLQLPIGLNKWVLLAYRTMIPVFVMLIFMQLVNLVMAFFEKKAAKTESTLDDQLVPLLKNLGKSVVGIFFFLYILNMLKIDVTALVGGVAFGSLAFALAAQDTVKNLFGSFLIFVDRPFKIGDWVVIDGHEGVVEEVSVRSTRIRTFANSIISIPNGNIASTAIDNMGLRAYRRFVTRIGVTYDTPPDLIVVFVDGIKEIIRKHPDTRDDVFEVAFNEMGDSSLQILVYAFFRVPSWTLELEGRQTLLVAVMKLAEELGISFAFPTQTLHIENFPEKKSLTPAYKYSEAEYRKKMQEFLVAWEEQLTHDQLHRKEQRGSEIDDGGGG